MAINICSSISVFLLLFFNSLYSQVILPPPDSLHASQQCDEIYLTWKVPQQTTLEILGYNVYLQDSLLAFTIDTTYQTHMQGNGFVVFNVTTVYNAGESLPASIEVQLVIYSPATNLSYDKNECEFKWNSPLGNHPSWISWEEKNLQWCDNNNYTQIGTGAEQEFEVAAVWSPDQLSQFSNGQLFLTEVDFYPTESTASYTVRVWQGENPEEPDEIIYDQPVTNLNIDQWNSITLIDSTLINTDEYLWVGYEVNALIGYPAGVDDGPAIDGYGNMMNWGGWQTLLEINPDLDNNWNIRSEFQFKKTENEIIYNIYGYWVCYAPWEHWVKLNEQPITDTSYFYACLNPSDEWWVDSCFVQVNYCNVPVNSDTVISEICWFSNSDPVDNDNGFTVYNTFGNWNIHSDDALIKLIIYNLTGKIIYIRQDKYTELTIDNQSFTPGLYIIEAITAKEKFVRKIYK